MPGHLSRLPPAFTSIEISHFSNFEIFINGFNGKLEQILYITNKVLCIMNHIDEIFCVVLDTSFDFF
jgi:hypothetical protein